MELKELCNSVSKMEYDDLMLVLDAVILRWRQLFADWEIVVASVPKNDPDERRRILEFAIKMINAEEKKEGIDIN